MNDVRWPEYDTNVKVSTYTTKIRAPQWADRYEGGKQMKPALKSNSGKVAGGLTRYLSGCLSLFPLALPVMAQEARGSLEEIVVTAERREASLQETPLAITAIGGEALENARAESTLDLQLISPGVLVSTNTASAQIYMRGVGTNFGGDQSTAVHVDGVVQVTTYTALQDFLDVERLEVLKGPQGTLYGRNATAGVINIISKRPTMDFELQGDLLYGSFNKFRQRAMVNAPIVDGRAAARLSLVNSDMDGYRRNPYLGTRIDDENHWAARGQLLLTPHDDLEIVLAGNYSNENSSRTLGFKINPNVYAPQVDLLPTLGLAGGTVPDDPSVIFSDKDSIQDFTQSGGSIAISWDLGAVTLKSLTAYQENERSQDIDVDGTEIPYFNSYSFGSRVTWFTQELQVLSNPGGPLAWVAGLFYLTDDHKDRAEYTTPLYESLGLASGPINNDADSKGEAYAVFGQASYLLSERWRLTAGARYSHERKEATGYINNDVSSGLFETRSASWNAFTPRVSLDFFPADDMMLYVSATKGFKTGGFNNTRDAFDPEYIWSYEAGLRSTLWDKRLRLNATAFYYDYSDIQFFQALSAPDPETGATTEVANAAAAEVKGLELELALAPFEGLQIGLNAALLDARYKDAMAPNTELPDNPVVDLSGNRMPQAPKFAGSLSARYSWPVGNLGVLAVQTDVYHQSRIYFSAFNEINGPYDQQQAYEIVNARVELESEDGRWNVSLYGRNLGDTVYRQNVIRAIGFFGQLDLLAPPRTYGVQVGFKL